MQANSSRQCRGRRSGVSMFISVGDETGHHIPGNKVTASVIKVNLYHPDR